eukprot:9786965-Alexandrium_andersonii.AAC.1
MYHATQAQEGEGCRLLERQGEPNASRVITRNLPGGKCGPTVRSLREPSAEAAPMGNASNAHKHA